MTSTTEQKILIQEAASHFTLGTKVKKKSGSNWHGKVVGYYSTDLTPMGVCVESAYEAGSVQIYPIKAMELWDENKL